MTTPAGAVAAAIVVRLRSPLAAGVFAAGGDPLKLSWSVTGAGAAMTQVAYEVEAAPEPSFGGAWTTGTVASADQIAVPAPGSAAHQPRGQVRAGPDPDRARLVAMVGCAPPRGGTAPAGGLGRPSDHAARRRRVDPAGAAAAGAAVVHARRFARLGPVVRHGARAPPGHAQRQAGLRRPVGARLDRIPAPPPGGYVRRHRPVAPGRERDRRRDRRRLVSRAARLQARRRPCHVRPRRRGYRPARGAPRRRLDDGRRDGRHVASVHRRDPIGRPVRRVRDRPSRAPGRAGTRLASTPRAGCRPRVARGRRPAHRAAPGAARAGHRRPARPRGSSADPAGRCSTAGRTSRATSG